MTSKISGSFNARVALRAWWLTLCLLTALSPFLLPSHAEASTYLTLLRDLEAEDVPAPLKIRMVGVYWDDLVKIDETWFFRSRRLEPTFRATAAEA